jgi:dCTP diphosphatase
MQSSDSLTALQQLKESLLSFRDARDWKQFHTPKDLALAIGIEAGELGEHFLWKTPEQIEDMLRDPEKADAVKQEFADILIYALHFANVMEIDVATEIQKKLAKNALKYPIDKAKGNAKKYTEL